MRSDQSANGAGLNFGVADGQQASIAARRDAETLALRALAYIVGDADLGPRLLDLTGLDVATLRARAADPELLAATLAFLSAHEPSLIACARALAVAPTELTLAHRLLAA